MIQRTLPDSDLLQSLIPDKLPRHRADRYRGDGIDRNMAMFHPADQQRLRDVYATLQRLLGRLRQIGQVTADDIRRFIDDENWNEAVAAMKAFGRGTPEGDQYDLKMAQVIHDLRGGAFQSIAAVLQMVELEMADDDDLRQLFFMVRDHLKIARNAVPDLDPAGYAHDLEHNVHDVALLVEKWGNSEYRVGDRVRDVNISASYMGPISDRCLEFSAVDRVLYNLVNNAASDPEGGEVDIDIRTVGEDHRDVRIVVANRIQPDHAAVLEKRYGESLDTLFRPGETTRGTGLGLRICADFVTNAYGLASPEVAVERRYLGARILGGVFVAWFHWPVG